jgi:hypothetical protein
MAGIVERVKAVVRSVTDRAEAPKVIQSWMNLFQTEAIQVVAETEAELAEAVRRGPYFCIGASHSYNGVQIIRDATALMMKASALRDLAYDEATGEVTVGPGVTIRELKEYLVRRDRRLISSGNFMAQTVIGAVATGTHGYGPQAVMAEAVTALEFLDGRGERVRLARGDPGFDYAALAFGLIAPIVSLTMETAPTECFEARTVICRLSEKDRHVRPEHAVMYAVFPYSDRDDPVIALQTVTPAPSQRKARTTGSPFFTLRAISEFIIHRYWHFDGLFPALRRPFQRLIARLNVRYDKVFYTDPNDLDYLYDPTPGLESSRSPNILTKMYSPTHTAYNLAFFVPAEKSREVVDFVMQQADHYRRLGFYLRSMIGVREISSQSTLPFAGNFNGPVAAIDLFADVRYYAWLERIQRETFAYFDGVRPHWGKSAIVEEFADTLGRKHLDGLKRLHHSHYRHGHLRATNRIRRLFGLPVRPHA